MKNIFSFMLCSVVILFSCKNSKKENNDLSSSDSSNVSKYLFGAIDGKEVYQFKLTNQNNVSVAILNYGGTITSINVPDKNGQMGDVVLGFDSLSGYLQKDNPYFGCLVGRYANRIANAKFKLNGVEYKLAANDGKNTLHGGLKGFDKVIWNVVHASDTSLLLSYESKDGEEGFPGNVKTEVLYIVSSNNELKIIYKATTDKATPINLTNHTYFNLSAGTDDNIVEHELQLDADQFTEVNKELIPTGKQLAVAGTPMDFNESKRIGFDIEKVKGGYDHNWVLNKKPDVLARVGSLYHPASGRYMEIFTTQPGIQFYSGNFLDGKLTGKKGQHYLQHGGLALETQHYPDSPNQPSFPTTILQPAENYFQTTIYKFSVK